jgi:hypothetical protein
MSEVSEGDSLPSGAMIVSHSLFRVPERDSEQHGYVAGNIVLLRGSDNEAGRLTRL